MTRQEENHQAQEVHEKMEALYEILCKRLEIVWVNNPNYTVGGEETPKMMSGDPRHVELMEIWGNAGDILLDFFFEEDSVN